MTSMTASQVRANLYNLVNRVSVHHTPIQITGKHHNAILIAEEDWQAITETLYLLSIPGMRKSIVSGMKTSVKKCAKKLAW